jgi:adenosine deaminase
VTLARNSFLGSFLTDAEVAQHLAAIDAYAARHGVSSLEGAPDRS